MTLDTLNKANKIGDAIMLMDRLYNSIKCGNCISLKNVNGDIIITTDPVLISAVKCSILNRQSELAEELERL